jgi:cold shock CspA family protein
MNNGLTRGTVIFFDKTYGFIRPNDGTGARSENVFLAGGCGFEPETGDVVEFRTVQYPPKGSKAVGVRLLSRGGL